MTNPILTIAGVMPGTSEATHWRSGMNRPTGNLRPNVGPSISIAGVMPGGPTMSQWQTAYPHGEAVYVVAMRAAEAKAALQAKAAAEVNGSVPALPRRTVARRKAA